jgi:hypothetical protein
VAGRILQDSTSYGTIYHFTYPNTNSLRKGFSFDLQPEVITSAINMQAEATTVQIYPNPTTNTVNIKSFNGGLKNVVIYNALGTVVYTQKVNQMVLTINLDLPAGLYVVQTTENNGKLQNTNLIVQ